MDRLDEFTEALIDQQKTIMRLEAENTAMFLIMQIAAVALHAKVGLSRDEIAISIHAAGHLLDPAVPAERREDVLRAISAFQASLLREIDALRPPQRTPPASH